MKSDPVKIRADRPEQTDPAYSPMLILLYRVTDREEYKEYEKYLLLPLRQYG